MSAREPGILIPSAFAYVDWWEAILFGQAVDQSGPREREREGGKVVSGVQGPDCWSVMNVKWIFMKMHLNYFFFLIFECANYSSACRCEEGRPKVDSHPPCCTCPFSPSCQMQNANHCVRSVKHQQLERQTGSRADAFQTPRFNIILWNN